MNLIRLCFVICFSFFILEISSEIIYPKELIVDGHRGPHQSCMGLYHLDGTLAFGYPRYSQENVSATHYLYRAGEGGRWIIVLGENAVIAKQGVLMSDSEDADTPVGLNWDSAQDGAWVRDQSLRVVEHRPREHHHHEQQQQQNLRHRHQDEEEVVMKSEFDAMAKRAMMAESKISALESDILTSNMLSDELEKKAEECLSTKEQTRKLLDDINEANSRNIKKNGQLEKELENFRTEITKLKEQLIEKEEELSQYKKEYVIPSEKRKRNQKEKEINEIEDNFIKSFILKLSIEQIYIIAGGYSFTLILVVYILMRCCYGIGGKKKKITTSSSSSSNISKKLDLPQRDDEDTEAMTNNDEDDADINNTKNEGSVVNDLPARMRSSQTVSNAPRPSKVGTGTPAKRPSAGKNPPRKT